MERWHPRSGRRHHPTTQRQRQEALATTLATLRDGRFSGGVACPRCAGRRVQRWGSFSGRQRYRCLGCRRTFSDLTGTPAAYLKKIELLPDYASCMAQCLSVRQAAALLGIHASTALRWRHRLLRAMADADDSSLSGWIEVSTLWFPRSFKGRPVPDRPARSRGPRYYRTTYEGARANVVVACDRHGHVLSALLPTRGPGYYIDTVDIEQALVPRVTGSPILTSLQGRFGACSRIARKRPGWRFRQAWSALLTGPDLAHVYTVRRYELRLRRWLVRFRGVATMHLPLYLSWHRAFDSMSDRGLAAALLRWPLKPSGFG